ncbi:carboxymethylenebutenolidase [Raphidocelis subcapitata]|uniref:Carboxymethylenebutenolidase n=1 Tax=Raphidocelis subcapitata TaxID=307507 RepID=A0A2V0P7Y6_9CHLO|nr:carboxymethylenebutenolidase [Raphidocelis subcapitata]|eukprot:GBF95978.1 carboxymethylenebutenolidase [Raphidocelis subcapitata]
MTPERRARLLELWDEHIATEFSEKSADAAVATMVPHATVNHVPTMTGGEGTEALRLFYATNFIPRMPADVKITPLSRTVGADADGEVVVDEFLIDFTHDVKMDWMLPGLEPTGKHVSVPFIVVVKFEGDRLKAERIYWDQATVLKQLGLLPAGLLGCVPGAEQAAKAADAGAVKSNGLIAAAAAAGGGV